MTGINLLQTGKGGVDACLQFNGTQDGKWVFFRKKASNIRNELANACQNGTSSHKLKGEFCFCTKDLCNSFPGQTVDVDSATKEIQVYLMAVMIVLMGLLIF